MIFVDSNPFVIALRYPRDRHARVNAAFLETLRQRGDAVTSVINVLEVCGILSYNLNERQLRALFTHFARRFRVRILPDDSAARAITLATPPELLTVMAGKASFGDALVVDALRRYAPATEWFVSWDAAHFRGRVLPRTVTPVQFLAAARA